MSHSGAERLQNRPSAFDDSREPKADELACEMVNPKQGAPSGCGSLDQRAHLLFLTGSHVAYRQSQHQQKRVILEMLGSHPLLKDKKLPIEAKKPFLILQQGRSVRSWWSVVEDVRTFCRKEQENLEKLREAFIKLNALLKKAA
ncbi:hypothetical protein MYX75_02325 [Acidobacteria bacterium AH-259-A15]|nr:hypothetical protein [Acidobacteria bacterium AH-259-A15]